MPAVCMVYLLSGMHWPITNLNPSQHFLLEKQRKGLLEKAEESCSQLSNSVDAFVRAQTLVWTEDTSPK